MSNQHNEEILFKLWDEAYEELVAGGMSRSEAEDAAIDLARERYKNYPDGE